MGNEHLDAARMVVKDRCPICSGVFRGVDDVGTINPDSAERLALRECRDCRHWWVSPMPAQDYLLDLYAQHSPYVVPEGYQGSRAMGDAIKTYAETILGFDPVQKPFKYLEIGIGSGELFKYLSAIAEVSYGVEPGGWKCAGTNIVSSIGELPEGVLFDLIVIQDVLEHVEDPVSMLSLVRSKASADCLLVCGYPNKDALSARVLKGRWSMVRPLGHLHFFSRASSVAMLESSGWSARALMACRPNQRSYLEAALGTASAVIRSGKLLQIPIMLFVNGARDQWHVRCAPALLRKVPK